MRSVVQRVTGARVEVDGVVVGEIGPGLLVLLGVMAGDSDDDARYMAEKIVGLRIFNDDAGKMNRDVRDCGGRVLVVSQFTLAGDVRKGRRPSFVDAAPPDAGERLYLETVEHIRKLGVGVATGKFRADMKVHLVNDGPVTILLDSKKLF